MKNLPEILTFIKSVLQTVPFTLHESDNDGRNNSAISEKIIIDIIKTIVKESCIRVPSVRSWYDILLYDTDYGWIPVNIKITTTMSADNIGNLACCVQSFTDYVIDLERNYDSSTLSKILIDSFKTKKYNTSFKKDYFFLVINKNCLISEQRKENDIIINSILSIYKFTYNCNNLPFQIKWSNNKVAIEIPIIQQIKKFQNLFKEAELPWSVDFINNMKNIILTDDELIIIDKSDIIDNHSICSDYVVTSMSLSMSLSQNFSDDDSL